MTTEQRIYDTIDFYKKKGWETKIYTDISYFRAIAKFICNRELNISVSDSLMNSLHDGCLFWDNIIKNLIMSSSMFEEETASKIYSVLYAKYYCRFVKLDFSIKTVRKYFIIERQPISTFSSDDYVPFCDKQFYYVMRNNLDIFIMYHDNKKGEE